MDKGIKRGRGIVQGPIKFIGFSNDHRECTIVDKDHDYFHK